MTVGDMGFTNSMYWSLGDAGTVVTGTSVVLLSGSINPHTYYGNDVYLINTFNYPNRLGAAWVNNNIGSAGVLYANYINASGTAVEEFHAVSLPNGQLVNGLHQISKYEYRILCRSSSTRVFTFYTVDVSAGTGTCTAGQSWTFTGSFISNTYTDFPPYTRSGNCIFEYRFTVYNDHEGKVHLYGMYADMENGTFSTPVVMYAVNGMSDWIPGGNEEWEGMEASEYTYSADYSITGDLEVSHDGDDGFLVRLVVQQSTMFKPSFETTHWYIERLKTTTFDWAGFALGEDDRHKTIVQDLTFSPKIFILDDPGWPAAVWPDNGHVDIYPNIFNSFYYYDYFESWRNEVSGTWSMSGSTAYPMTCSYSNMNPVSGYLVTETGSLLTTSTFRYGGGSLYLHNLVSMTESVIAESGYDIKTIFNRLDSVGTNILCWGKRNSDSWFGVLVFDLTRTFQRFIPVVSTFAEDYAKVALISNGFLAVDHTVYYLAGPPVGWQIRNIIEQN